MTDTGAWYYDWLHNRFRADYLNVFPNGTKSNETQLWLAYESKFYVFHHSDYRPSGPGPFCYWYDYEHLSILRPDAFSHAKANYTGRRLVNGRWADGFSSGDFNLDQDVFTNYPLRSHSGAGDQGYLETNFYDVVPGVQSDSLYHQFDTSTCPERKEQELGSDMQAASLFVRLAAAHAA